jgi:hypothetical protein
MAHNPELTKFEPCDFPVPDEAVEWAKKRGRKKPANRIEVDELCYDYLCLKNSWISISWSFWHKNGVAYAVIDIKDDCSILKFFAPDLPF